MATNPLNISLFRNMLKNTILLISLCFFGSAFAGVPDHIQRSIAQGKHIEAVQQLEAWVKENSRDYHSLFVLGKEYANTGMFHKAIEAFKHVSALRPSLADPHVNLASIYNVMGEYQMAINEMNLYIEKSSGSAISHENLAELHLRAARQSFKTALALTPNAQLESKLYHLQEAINPSSASRSPITTIGQKLPKKKLFINTAKNQLGTPVMISSTAKIEGGFAGKSKTTSKEAVNDTLKKEVLTKVKSRVEIDTAWARVSRYGPIASGDSIGIIAQHIRSDMRFSNEQVMIALFEKNKSEFNKKNINFIKIGKFLDVPTTEEVAQISDRNARSMVIKQQREWKSIINKRNMQKSRVAHRISVR